MGEIKFDEENHTAMTESLNTVKSKLADVTKKIKELQSEFNGNFEGEAATALDSALSQLKKETDDCTNNWEKVIESADNIATSLKNADNAAKSTIDNGSTLSGR
ncbi:WXG100 family type VII secretion target [Streptococcus gallolyticus]|uniref:Uncharacterized protein n=1 Tax=Streptococcus gallolyticus TaxID=315405 RepID=A0A139QPH4_9STRE|nr:WXG100 family type VII secretion target [Streptococcus gallolyticus]KXT67136.1 hypothetical protein SGADD02_01504 [Streptococcus gallolyticus]KXU04408.1 hypothetical protein SGADD03_01851 [Streptococcus gallolyticus]